MACTKPATPFVSLFAIVVLQGVAGADDSELAQWPQFRGPNASGVAQKGRYPFKFGPEKNVIWKEPVPTGVSSPCIWGDRIFLTAYTPADKKLETLCVQRTTGKLLWRRTAPAERIEKVHKVSSPANATPATDGNRVHVYFASFGLLCYDFDGNEIWKKSLPLAESLFGSGTSPIVVGDLVLLNRDSSANPFARDELKPHILAVDARTGETAWKTPRPGSFVKYSTPVISTRGGVQQVLLMGGQRLSAYELATGEERWSVDGLPPQACATPVLSGDRVYVSATGMYGEPEAFLGIPEFDAFLKDHDKDGDGLIGIAEIPKDFVVVERRASGGAGNSPLTQFISGADKDGDKKLNKEEWGLFRSRVTKFMTDTEPGVFAIRLGGSGNVSETHIQWRDKRGVAEVPSPLVYEQRLYLVRNGGIVHCRDITDGRELFGGRLEALGGYYASPVAGDGKIYFASDGGVVTILKASDKLAVIGQNDLGDRIVATPALVDSTLYVRTDHHLYAFRDP